MQQHTLQLVGDVLWSSHAFDCEIVQTWLLHHAKRARFGGSGPFLAVWSSISIDAQNRRLKADPYMVKSGTSGV